MNDDDPRPSHPPPFPGSGTAPGAQASPAAAAPSAKASASPRPSVEQVFGEVRGAVSGASQREPYPWLAVATLGFTALWLMWPEGGAVGAAKLKLWTVFVLTSVLMVFAPMMGKLFRLDGQRAWQIAVAGAGGLGFAWVAFLLPSISSNQAFFGTFATLAAALAAWTAPGKPSS